MDEIEEVKKRINIVDFIGTYVQLKKAGRNFRANCPFHQEHSPSFIVSADRQIWHCFGSCHEVGDVIAFLMKLENLTFAEALRELAKQTGVVLKQQTLGDDESKKRERLYGANLLAAKYYHYVLMQTPPGRRAKEYLLTTRAVHEKIAQTYQIGYAPDSWDSLKTYLIKKGYSEFELEAAGLVSRAKSGRTFDRFRARLIFPISDTRGNIIGFSGRILDGHNEAGETAKYVNTQETSIYHKRESLFGIYQAKDHMKKLGFALLVEGEFDAILPYQHDVGNVVAVKGSAITRDQLQLIKRYCPKIVFAMDADSSGIDAIKRGLVEAEALEMEMAVVQLVGAKDPDEAVRADAIAFKKAVTHPLPVYDFLFEQLLAEHATDGAYGKKYVIDGIVEHLINIKNPIIQSHYIKLFAKQLEVDEESVKKAMKIRWGKIMKRKFGLPTKSQPKQFTREQTVQRYVLSMLIQKQLDEQSISVVKEQIRSEYFAEGAYRKLYELVKEHMLKSAHTDITATLPAELMDLYNELYLLGSYDEEGVLEEHKIRMIYELKLLALKQAVMASSKQILEKTDEDGDHELYQDLKKQLAEVEKTMSSL